jgi:4-hydroxy-tetrahydrodipicolinate synthase
MPGCSQPEAFVEVWNRFHAGDEPGAREVFDQKLAPVNRLAGRGWSGFYHTHKEILRRRGVIRCAKVRGPVAPLDAATSRELQVLIEELFGGAGE